MSEAIVGLILTLSLLGAIISGAIIDHVKKEDKKTEHTQQQQQQEEKHESFNGI